MKIDCDIVKDLYVLYKENELSPKVKKAVEEHLQQCQSCSMVYEKEEGFEDFLQNHEIEIEPSKKFDEQMKFKIKLRRWRIAALFIAAVLLIYSYFQYVDDRKNILYAIQGATNNVNHMSLTIGSVKSNREDFGHIFEQLDQLQEKHGAIIRELNYFERKSLSDHPNGLFIGFEFVDFLEHLNIRHQNNVWTENDEKALGKMKDYMEEYLKILEQERNKLNGVYKDLDLNVLFNFINVEQMADLNQKINELSYTYTNYGKFPDEIDIFSRGEISEILSNIFDVSIEDIKFPEYANRNVKSTGEYRFEISSKDYNMYGTIDAFTGKLIGFNSIKDSLEGDVLPEETIRIDLEDFIKKAFGDNLKFTIKSRGINYRFSSNTDVKLYTFDISPENNGYALEGVYRVYINARTGNVQMLSRLEGYILEESFNDAKVEINLDPQEGLRFLENEIEDIENYKYQGTVFIRSILSRDYQLVHKYIYKNSHKEVYINTGTGKQEFLD